MDFSEWFSQSVIATTTITTAAIATEKISEALFECFGLSIDDATIFHDIFHVLLGRIRFHLALFQHTSIEYVIKCGSGARFRIRIALLVVFFVNEMAKHGCLHEPFKE